MIIIYTGKVHTGKTTALKKWVSDRKDVGGFLTPDIDGMRKFEEIASGETIAFQIENTEEEDSIEVGPYIFKKSIFNHGCTIVENNLKDGAINTIIIDEMGKLEMKGEGFAKIGKMISQEYMRKNFIVVVRDYLTHQIPSRFDFPMYLVVDDVTEL